MAGCSTVSIVSSLGAPSYGQPISGLQNEETRVGWLPVASGRSNSITYGFSVAVRGFNAGASSAISEPARSKRACARKDPSLQAEMRYARTVATVRRIQFQLPFFPHPFAQ